MGMVLWFASMAYGGLHSAAWHHYLPSKIEAWLWRASSVCIAGSGLTWSVINLLAQISTSFKAYWKDVILLRAHWISLVGLGSLATSILDGKGLFSIGGVYLGSVTSSP